MYDSFHSGIEGYCKMAAKMLDVPDKISGWLPFCKDILPDRTKANITRVWTSSNERGGRGCRLSTFEDNWLQYPRDTYDYEAECLANHEQPTEGFRTINDDTYISNLTSCKNAEARKQAVRRRYEHDALALCVNSMVDKAKSYDGSQIGLISLLHVDDFPVRFYSTVIPAIERGFVSERYLVSDARQFGLTVNDLLARAQRELLQEDAEYKAFRKLVTVLFASLIYGPNHPMATGNSWNATEAFIPYHKDIPVNSLSIRVTQIFNNDMSYEGYSEVFNPEQVVFFGRSANLEVFVDKCNEYFEHDKQILTELKKREAIQFPIADSHDAVGITHGMLLCTNNTWRFYDFGSHNKTSVQSEQGSQDIDGVLAVRPGDILRLGAPKMAHDANVFWSAAAMHVSCYVERERELYV